MLEACYPDKIFIYREGVLVRQFHSTNEGSVAISIFPRSF